MARYDGVKFGFRAPQYADYNEMLLRTRGEGFGDEVKRRILFGIYTLSGGRFNDYYLKAQKIRTLIIEEYAGAFGKYDLLLTPAAPLAAPLTGVSHGQASQAFSMEFCTAPANLAGLPAISVPWDIDKEGMPIGVQLMGAALSEELILKAAHGVEVLSHMEGGRKDV
jgi:aspartyl-tRNA(Asn)/glutamyl-tRNA(Gln) amidotransferase subunit A